MFDQINAHVNRYVTLSADELELLDSLLVPQRIPKKTLLLKEGDLCCFESYINKGCIRSYYIDETGQEVILQFAVEDWWVSDLASFHEHIPSKMFIETLEDCELLTLNPATKEHLLTHIPQLERMFRIMVQRNLSSLQDRLFSTITNSAEDKYRDFIRRYPDIPQRVAQHYIASYLGISPEFLSKIRGRIAKKNQ